ncbi:expressed unknown protein [Seminavis robusta]|uniref:Uncharacterized protein n=1 Tax=Seminavis robusta TaxID=568900 RepID=A0A9N8DUW6_9STRA|nr:expressed unknown protein [Seminavis robusta]|eukprot:Sro389_g132690.1 n/a (110) ;mRNA; r:56195-56524
MVASKMPQPSSSTTVRYPAWMSQSNHSMAPRMMLSPASFSASSNHAAIFQGLHALSTSGGAALAGGRRSLLEILDDAIQLEENYSQAKKRKTTGDALQQAEDSSSSTQQ